MADSFDELLDAAAPTLADRGSARDVELAQMVRDARDTVLPPKRSRRRAGLLSGALALVLVGGGGVAVATGFVTWPDRYQTAEHVAAFRLASGRECESRFVVADSETGDPLRTPVTDQMRRWLTETDLFAAMDLDAARARDAEQAAQSPDQTVIIGAEGWLMDVPQPPQTRSADDLEATLIDSALRDVIYRKLVDAGVPLNGWTILGGVKCEV